MDVRGLGSELMKFCSRTCQGGEIKDARFQGWLTGQWWGHVWKTRFVQRTSEFNCGHAGFEISVRHPGFGRVRSEAESKG